MNDETLPSPAPQRIRVMVVEDEADIALIVKQMLGPRYEVVHASNGLEALERLNWYQPDLTIMDLMMPVLNGFDTTRAIKKDNDYSAMPVMFLTARKDNQAVREALMAGGDIYLEKPFDPPELLIHLEDMIARNGVVARPKRYTLDQIRQHFDGAPAAQASTQTHATPGERFQPLTEQLARAAAAPKARVLVIMESESDCKKLRDAVRTKYEILTSTNPELALDKIIAYQPDILVVKIEMPTFDGVHYAQLLRINRHLRVPNLILASQGESPRVAEAARRWSAEVLTGDLTAAALVSKLDDITKKPGFVRQRKRLDYREILRREDSRDDDF